MNKKILIFSVFSIAIAAAGFFLQQSPVENETEQFAWEEDEESEYPKDVRIKEAILWNNLITQDTTLGYPPTERLAAAIEHTRRLQERYYGESSSMSRAGLSDARWKERGPNNIGGRTRAILIDEGDPSRNKIWAGSVSGGLWYTNDITATDPNWQKVNDYLDNLSIGGIAQDPNDPNIMYFGTGESYTGIVPGIGIYKSTDNGINWELLPSTSTEVLSDFEYTQTMLVHPETGDVYAGTSRGLHRSTDGGANWQEVLGAELGTQDFINDLFYEGGKLWASTNSRIYKSETGNPNDWEALGTGFGPSAFPGGWGRCEFTVCHTDPDIIYALGRTGQPTGATKVYRSLDGGETWSDGARPESFPGNEFTNGQAWYDLDIAVNPFDCNQVVVGGVPTLHSFSAASVFEFTNGNGHVDQHLILFDKEKNGRVLHGNDGGIYYRDNNTNGDIIDKNFGYNVTQFYAGAIHPEAYSNYMLGGTQDNNSLQMNAFGISGARNVNGGDGMFCHIDQNEGDIQIVSSQFGNYRISDDGGNSFSGGINVEGEFLNISDYDNDANILYAQSGLPGGNMYRHSADGTLSEGFNANIGLISAIHCDPNVDNRIYVGSIGGRVYRIDNAHTGANVEAVQIAQVGGVIISIDIEYGNPDHLLISRANYGVTNNIYESTDGGQTWVGVEGTAIENNLPDVPVRWAVFHPEDANQAMIATDVGVWGTENLNGDNTIWFPPVPNRGTPLVRTDMLQVRTSDRFVLAATHGRGMWTSDVWADPRAFLVVPKVGYTDGRLFFNGSASVNADTYDWDLGDGTTSEQEDFFHSYENIGSYDVSLTLNNEPNNADLNAEGGIKILPSLPVPYTADEADYGGGFESNDEQWGVDNIGGNSTWERGASEFTWKDGTNSGENVFVIEPDSQYYQKDSEAYLYLPNFDFSENTIYEFSFFARYQTAPARDGFNVQYSLNKGETWQVLGNGASNWYNFPNTSFDTPTPFPFGEGFFTGELGSFTQFKLNVSDLFAGEENVAFRFVFRAGSTAGNYAGVAIDDVRISKYDGEPVTNITRQAVEFDLDPNPDELVVSWTTQPEYYADKFDIYTSIDGIEFTRVETVDARGVVTAASLNYSARLPGNRSLYFVQIQGISVNEEIGLNDTLTMPVMVANKEPGDGVEIFSTAPNPFVDDLTLTFNDFIAGPLKLELFDMAGRLILTQDVEMNGFATNLSAPNLATGWYVLRYTVKDEEPKIYSIVKSAN